VVESSPPLISKLEIRADGSAGGRSVLVELPRQVPDGVALDVDGDLYISLFNPNIIYRCRPDGTLVTLYDDWEQLKLIAPTNIAFGGADLSTLIIASLCGWAGAYRADASAGAPGPLSEALTYPHAASWQKIAWEFHADADFDRRAAGLVQA
jgi:sugar lactone lactonase YvrE